MSPNINLQDITLLRINFILFLINKRDFNESELNSRLN